MCCITRLVFSKMLFDDGSMYFPYRHSESITPRSTFCAYWITPCQLFSWITQCLWINSILMLKDKKAAVKIIPFGGTAGRMEVYNLLCLIVKKPSCSRLQCTTIGWKIAICKQPKRLSLLRPADAHRAPADTHCWRHCFHWTPQEASGVQPVEYSN